MPTKNIAFLVTVLRLAFRRADRRYLSLVIRKIKAKIGVPVLVLLLGAISALGIATKQDIEFLFEEINSTKSVVVDSVSDFEDVIQRLNKPGYFLRPELPRTFIV